MTIHPHAVLVRWFFIIGLLLIVGKISFDLLTHPAVVTTAGVNETDRQSALLLDD